MAFLSEGEEGNVVAVRGGRGLAQRLTDMGLTPSTKVKVLRSCPPGPILLQFRDSRIALGRGIAMKILVSRSEGL
ncbi:MAG TPA: FeoA domain-containing protein [Methanothrix sp.]|nr:FeoA domain-containing protein [Methanothrix sp.]HNT72495.1 FeoA domain-containing protein [Methanothrix sp.]HOI69114.1 FeoA domain-containing protein [Methanothrix sp.]